MKITDPDIIKNGEKDLIEAVMDDLDPDAVKEILKKKMETAAISSKGGEIVVHNNEIAYRLDFDIQLSGSLMFDRQGNYISDSVEAIDDVPDVSVDQEDLMSEDFNLEDININEALEEVAPQTRKDDDDEDTEIEGSDTSEVEELSIDLPDYDLDEEIDTESIDPDETIETDILDNEENENPAKDLDPLLDDAEPDADDTVDKTDLEPEEDIVDDDMSDILKESQDFWDPKKDE